VQLEDLQKLIEQGLSTRAIAKKCDCAQTTVNYWLKKYNLKTKNTYYQDGDLDKICNSCGILQPVGNFSKRKDRNSRPVSYCKSCEAIQGILRRKERKLKFIDYKGGKCESCGYCKSLSALEFHHIYPDKKEFTISAKRSLNEETKKELDKCKLLCSNCHREAHDELVNAKYYL